MSDVFPSSAAKNVEEPFMGEKENVGENEQEISVQVG